MNREHSTTEGEMKDIWDRLTRGEESIKSAHKRIDELKDLSKGITDLAASTAQVATETKALREDFIKMDGKVETLENKPIKTYNTVVTTIITSVCSAGVGYLIATLFA